MDIVWDGVDRNPPGRLLKLEGRVVDGRLIVSLVDPEAEFERMIAIIKTPLPLPERAREFTARGEVDRSLARFTEVAQSFLPGNQESQPEPYSQAVSPDRAQPGLSSSGLLPV